MHEVLVNRLGGLSLPRKNVVRLTDRPNMTIDVYLGHKKNNTTQQQVTTFSGITAVCIKCPSVRHTFVRSISLKQLTVV